MVANPLGAVYIWDGGTPKTITAYAGSTISGGQVVYISGASGVVSSGADTYVTSDLVATTGGSGGWVAGIALHNAASGTPITIATEGTFICVAGATIEPSETVECLGDSAFQNTGSVDAVSAAGRRIGRALTGAGSESYFILKLNVA